MMALLCKQDDVFVGYAALGVVLMPEDKDPDWLASHCWLCGRSDDEIRESVRTGGR